MIFVALIPIVVCAVVFVAACTVGKAMQRGTANCLIVLSGILAALAIFVPLGATLLPASKGFGWPGWLLVGALLSGAICLFGIVSCMIALQDEGEKFATKGKARVPCWINTAWIALGWLALAAVLIKVPWGVRAGTESPGATRVRFAVARELPALGSRREIIETEWGAPALANNGELRYQTNNGTIIFCLNSEGVTQSITETQEVNVDAIGKFCGQN
jgi:hypothetical protein